MRSKDLIISMDEVKTFDKIQHHFLINALRKLGIEGISIFYSQHHTFKYSP
jgi:hypothetical protein